LVLIKKQFNFYCGYLLSFFKMMLYSPRAVCILRKLLGPEKNKKLLKSFVNAILSSEEQMSEAIYKENTEEEEYCILNIEAIDERGYRYDIRIEVADKLFGTARLRYHWSKVPAKDSGESKEVEESNEIEENNKIEGGNKCEKNNESEESNESEENNECELVKKTIVIFIINWNYFENTKTYHTALQMTIEQSEEFEMHFIELERFKKSVEELENRMDYWAYFLMTVDKCEIDKLPRLFKRDPDLKSAIEALEKIKLDEEEEEIYKEQMKEQEDMRNMEEVEEEIDVKQWQAFMIRMAQSEFGDVPSNYLKIIAEMDEKKVSIMKERFSKAKSVKELIESLE
jgi:hypothetical protein